MNMKIKEKTKILSFKDLDAWKGGYKLVLSICNIMFSKPLLSFFLFLFLSFLPSPHFLLHTSVHAATYNASINPGTDSLSRGLIGWYTLDGADLTTSAIDRSGSGYNGTMNNFNSNNSDAVVGKLGQGLRFSRTGNNSYIRIANSGAISNLTGFTYSYWMKADSFASSPVTLNNFINTYGSPWSGALAFIDTNGLMYWQLRLGDVCCQTLTSSGNFSPNRWYHVANVWDGTNLIIYIDGVSNNSTADGTSGSLNAYRDTFIGINSDQFFNSSTIANKFSGILDDVRIYNRALSATEIKRLYQLNQSKVNNSASVISSTDSLKSGLVGWWTLDGVDTPWTSATAATTIDKSGNGNTGTLTNMNRTVSTSIGKLGQALNFDGSDDYVDAGDSSSLSFDRTNPVSFAFWMKTATTNTQVLIDKFITTGISISVGNTGTGIWFMTWRNSAGTNELQRRSSSNTGVTDGKWHYITITYTGSSSASGLLMYIDGVSSALTTTVDNLTSTVDNNASFAIGARQSSVGAVPFNGSIDDIRIYNRALSQAEISRLYGQTQSKYNTSAVTTNTATSLKTGLVGHWTFDGLDLLTNVADKSGNGNNGFMSGFTSTSSATTVGRLGQAIKMDGVSNAIFVPNSSSIQVGGGNLSVSVWIYPKSFGSYKVVFEKGSSSLAREISFFINTGAQGWVSFGHNGDSSGATINFSPNFTTNEWQHLTVTRSGNTVYVYRNGVQVGSVAMAYFATNSSALYFGYNSSSGGSHWNGNLDDIRVYNRALSTSEILALYNMGR